MVTHFVQPAKGETLSTLGAKVLLTEHVRTTSLLHPADVETVEFGTKSKLF